MWIKMFWISILISVGVLGYVALSATKSMESAGIAVIPESKNIKEVEKGSNPFEKPINILLLGIDRRSRLESSYRTDIMILVSLNPDTNKIVLASIPRDLWYEGERINALYISHEWEKLQTAIEEVTGLKPERFILTDFKDFSWVVDAMGGVTVDIERSFTDTQYPVDVTKTYQTVSFIEGPEKLTGARALIYSRSRKGTNGEGSDWARMQRQHLVLKGMLEAIQQPTSLFQPMVIKEAYKTITEGRMDTNLKVTDAQYLWDFYKDKDKYEISSLFLDYDYLYSPPMEQYGGAWVLVSKTGTYEPFKNAISKRLQSIETDL